MEILLLMLLVLLVLAVSLIAFGPGLAIRWMGSRELGPYRSSRGSISSSEDDFSWMAEKG